MHCLIFSLILLPLMSSQTTCVSWSSIRMRASSFSKGPSIYYVSTFLEFLDMFGQFWIFLRHFLTHFLTHFWTWLCNIWMVPKWIIKFPGPGSSTLSVAIPWLWRLCSKLEILIFPNKYCDGYLSLPFKLKIDSS